MQNADTLLGPIRTDEILPLSVFKARTGLSTHALREARKAGLKIAKIGRRKYVCGSEFAAHVKRIMDESR